MMADFSESQDSIKKFDTQFLNKKEVVGNYVKLF